MVMLHLPHPLWRLGGQLGKNLTVSESVSRRSKAGFIEIKCGGNRHFCHGARARLPERCPRSLCNNGQLETVRLEELHSPDLKLLSLTADAVEKLNLGGIPGQRRPGADPFHKQRTRFFEAPLDRPICPDQVLEIARRNRN